MTTDRLRDYFDHMIEATRLACSYVEGMGKDDFLGDKRTQQAVILNIIVIGEVASKLLAEHSAFLANHPEVAWRNMKGMRNRIAHGYFDINMEIVWDTVCAALPALVTQISSIRQSLPSGNDFNREQ